MSVIYRLSIFILINSTVLLNASTVVNVYTSGKTCSERPTKSITLDDAIIAFSVGRQADFSAGKDAIIPMDHVFYNDGGYFNMKTSTFTAPVTGLYAFYFGACAKRGNRLYLKLYVANKLVTTTYNYNRDFNHASGSVYKKMQKDEQASLWLSGGMNMNEEAAPNAHFNGHLLQKVV